MGGAPYDGVTQTIATTPGTTYQLTFDLGNDNTSANTGVLPTGNGIAEPSGSGAMPGWTVIGGTATGNDGVAWLSNANSYGLTAETGNYFVSLAGYRDNAPYFGVSQTVATTVGQTYALTFYLGVDNSSVYYTGPIGVSVTAGPVTQTIENVSPTGTGNQWVAETVDFTATAASSTISIQGVQGGDYIGLDNVSLVQTGNGATGTNLITNGDFAEPSINPVGVSVTAGPVTTTFNNVAPTALGNTWTPETLDFTATSTTSTISFQGDQGQNYIGLDNVVVSIPTAPSSPTGGVFSEDGKIDTFTVPTSGTYVITGTGATGGGLATGYTGGAGAEVQGTFTLAAGDELEILVGGVGSGQDGGAGSGGGGSFVFDVTTDTLLEAAGGGGGASAGSGGTGSAGGPGGAGQAGTSGTAGGNYVNGAGTSFGGAGGTAGSGGAAGAFVDSTAGSDSGGGGGGFDSAGGDGAFGDGGAGFLAGGAGGIGASLNTQHNGGFGGGGGANSDSIGAGGGGGFSGGGGGEENVGGGGGSFIAPVATDVTLTGGENADGNGSVTIALAAATPDVFTDTEAASSGPLAGSYLWSDPNNWSAGVPSDGATVTADGSGYDDIASLSLASLNVTSGESYVIANSLTVGTVMVSGALTTLFADSGNAPGPVTVTVGAIDTSGNSYGAIGAGSSFIDNSATDPGNSYQAVVGGLVELASLSDASNLQINNGGTIALSNPAASTGALFEDLTAGDVLELPGTSVSNVSFTTNGLTVTTGGPGGGTYAFTNVSYFGTPLSGFTATHDATTGLEAITFTSPDVFTDTEAASSGPLAGSYLWSDPNNWSAGVPSDGATVTADGSGYDDIASLSLASLNVTSGESYVIANSLTVGTVMVSGALTTLFADSGNAPGPVTVTVGAIDTSGNSYGAIGAGSSFIDNSATDPGNSYQAVVGGLVELASLSDASNLQINNGGTIALSNPAASTGALFEDLTAGDVLELPGTSVSNVSFTTNGLTVTTGGPGGGTYAFTNVSYFGTPLSGFTATHDATTGLEAITFTSPDVFTDTEAASSGPLAGSYLWSDPNNWSAGVPSDGATVTADGSGYDDIASLSLASLNVTSGELYVIANSLTVGTVMVSGALTTLFADSGNAPGPVTVTVGAIDTSGNSYGAIGAGSSFIDNSATDPGNSYQAVVGGLVELASLSDASNLQINNGGTIALSNPAASTGALFEDLTAGDVLELPGTSVSNVSFTTNGLTVTTGGPGGGTYAFTNVSYFGTPLSGFTATHDATTGLEAITFTSPDVFTDTEAASSGPLAGSYLWSDPNNWSAGVPSDGATVTADGSGYDDIASLSLASLNVTSGELYVIANSLTVGTVMVSGALTTLFADSGNAPGPVTVTVGAIDTSGNSYGAIGAGSSFIDNSATDPGNSYQAVVGGLVELASLSDASNLQINNGGTIALSNPAASTGALFEDLTAGDVLELPGTSVSNVSFTTNGLTVTTGGPGGGTYAFTNVSYFGTPLSGFTATHDATTGLEAITFTSPDVFTDTEAASSGPLAGSYLWSDPNNWSAGVPSDGATVTADGSGYDDIASLSLASLNVTSGESYVIANSLTVGTVMVSGALTTLFADSGNAPGPVTVTVGAIDTSGNSYGAIGAGSSFIDNSATDPGNSYQAVVGGLVELASLSDASNLQINNGGTIALSNPAASTGALFEDLTAGDVLELPGTSVSNVSFTTNGLTVTTGGPGGGTYAFTNVSYFGTPLSGFTATHDATTGLEAITFTGGVPCYCRGTQIRTDRDEVAVEDLAIGDIVLTMSGTARPIKWIGRRSYKGRFVMGRKDILPICIKAGALDDNVPKRDLWISPNHAMYFENNGGVLVEAKDLVNGVSIVQVARVEEVEYVHIELDTHDVIIAEGALSETFIDDDSRGMFHNADEYCALHSAATMATMVRYCARRLQEGYEIEAVRRHIAPRAGLVSEEPSAGELRGYIDLIAPHVVEGWAQSVDHPEAPVCLDIFSGGRLIGQVLANRFRKDLEQANLGSGCHSFRFAVPDGVTFTPDSVAVKRSLDGKALPQSAQAKRVRKSIAA